MEQASFPALPGLAVDHRGMFKHVMALALNPKTSFKDGVIRCITSREGDVDVAGFIDHSELHVVTQCGDYQYEIGDTLFIHNQDEIIESLVPDEGFEFIGLEDPDLHEDEHGTLHLYFTMAFVNRRDGITGIFLGHAEGPDLHSLSMTAPVLAEEGKTAKEVALVPRASDGVYRHVIESSAPGSEHSAYSTVRVAIAHGYDARWDFGDTVLHPGQAGLPWTGGHASPGPFLSREFIDVGEGKLVGFLNGREHDRVHAEQVTFGTFAVGLYIYDYEHGAIDWVSALPVIEDAEAKTITFSSQFVMTAPGEGILYAHVDDSFVRAYRVTADAVRALLP